MINLFGVPMFYWAIMLVSHAIHVYLKVEADVRVNKVALSDYIHDYYKLSGVIIALIQSCLLLVIGYDSFIKLDANSPADLSTYISFVVAFIGYGGSSLWNNIMDLIKSKLGLKDA
jgi:amino acid permease